MKLFTIDPSGNPGNHTDCYTDAEGYFKSSYGAQPNMIYLIRPDGYVGFIGESVQELVAYFSELGYENN